MKRDIGKLAKKKYEVLVVGGGIYGACVAWDAALRGLSVALVEKSDFGSETSANSLKIIHGGLRYLQDLNAKRVRKMAVERSNWLRIAPHLVHPLTCLTPTYEKFSRSKLVLATALAINGVISFERKQNEDLGVRLPKGRTISREECQKILAAPELNGITGGAIWYDAQIYNSERLLLSFVLSAEHVGADVANYVQALRFIDNGKIISGVRAQDVQSGDEFDIQAEIVVNCAGAWIDGLLSQYDIPARYIPSKALNLVTHGIKRDCAIGLPGKTHQPGVNGDEDEQTQMLFFVPWRGQTIIGTKHFIDSKPVTDTDLPTNQVTEFIEEINQAFPSMNLKLDDVRHVHWGFLPLVDHSDTRAGVKLLRDSQVHDHQREDGLGGLISVVGVKFTTARATARQTVDLIVRKLRVKAAPSCTDVVPIYGGNIHNFVDYMFRVQSELKTVLDADVVKHLLYTYGSEYQQVLDYLEEEPALRKRVVDGSPVIEAEIVHAVREEMALNLNDVVRRRTELGATGLPRMAGLQKCAEIMGRELDWGLEEIDDEINKVISSFPLGWKKIDSKGG